jgi:sialidase-1
VASYSVSDTVIVHKDDYAYISHPSICVLDTGEWVAAFNHSRRREPRMHPPSDPLFRTLLARSSDQGKNWSAPYFAPDFDWYGTECPGIAQVSDGTVVLTQFRFGWYPLNLAAKKRAAGESISLSLPGKGWTEDLSKDDWARSQYTWARGYHGVYAHLSSDGGHTFDHTVKLDTTPYRDGYSRTGVTELSDGRIAYAITEHHPPHNRHTYILFSETGGLTWGSPVLIADTPELWFSEPDIAEVKPGELYCVLRDSKRTGYLHGSRSLDGGRTWSAPKRTSMHGHPGHLLALRDGRLLCTYGRREAPFGIRACLSEDGGQTWQTDQGIVVRDDLPNSDLGYPTTIEYEPCHLFCCYYGQEPDGITCVQGTHIILRS